MVREINIDSIRALEKQIEEHERAIIRLKRTRNSLLNVSTLLPPEVLGNIFRWNVIPDGDFGGLVKGSYNFLLVCHHWFEVASRTPGLWCSWGNSIRDWRRWYARCGTGPLDLVLGECTGPELDDELRNALQDRAARDAIRRVHLRGFCRAELLNSVISLIVTEEEGTRLNSMESFIVKHSNGSNIDVTGFFSRYHLPKLKCLRLSGCWISSLDLLGSRTTALTTLELTTDPLSPITPTLSQLVSILSSNPLLQELALLYKLAPHVAVETSYPLVPLCHLKRLRLSSNLRHVFSLISRLEIPDKINNLDLFLFDCSPSDLSQTLGPYLQDHVRRRGRLLSGGLGLSITHSYPTFHFRVGDADERAESAGVWFMTVGMYGILEEGEAEKRVFDLIMHIPREQIIGLRTNLPILHWEELCVEMRNLTRLQLNRVDLPTFFVEPGVLGPHAFMDLLHSLDHIVIIAPTLRGGDWGPLTDFLSRRAAAGNPISSLRLRDSPSMDEEVLWSIECTVEVFDFDGSDDDDSDGSDGSDGSGASDGSDESDH